MPTRFSAPFPFTAVQPRSRKRVLVSRAAQPEGAWCDGRDHDLLCRWLGRRSRRATRVVLTEPGSSRRIQDRFGERLRQLPTARRPSSAWPMREWSPATSFPSQPAQPVARARGQPTRDPVLPANGDLNGGVAGRTPCLAAMFHVKQGGPGRPRSRKPPAGCRRNSLRYPPRRRGSPRIQTMLGDLNIVGGPRSGQDSAVGQRRSCRRWGRLRPASVGSVSEQDLAGKPNCRAYSEGRRESHFDRRSSSSDGSPRRVLTEDVGRRIWADPPAVIARGMERPVSAAAGSSVVGGPRRILWRA